MRDKNWEDCTKVDDHADEVPHSHRNSLPKEKVEELIHKVAKKWKHALPYTFSIEILPSEQYWRIVAIDKVKKFRSSAMISKRRAYELRITESVRGLINDYFYETESMPIQWGEYI